MPPGSCQLTTTDASNQRPNLNARAGPAAKAKISMQAARLLVLVLRSSMHSVYTKPAMAASARLARPVLLSNSIPTLRDFSLNVSLAKGQSTCYQYYTSGLQEYKLCYISNLDLHPQFSTGMSAYVPKQRPQPHPQQNVLHVTSDDSTSSASSSSSTGSMYDIYSSPDLARCSRCHRTPSIDIKTGKSNMVQYGLNLYYCSRCAAMVGFKR